MSLLVFHCHGGLFLFLHSQPQQIFGISEVAQETLKEAAKLTGTKLICKLTTVVMAHTDQAMHKNTTSMPSLSAAC